MTRSLTHMLLLITSCLVGCDNDGGKIDKSDVQSFTVFIDSWHIEIAKDGSATVIYGSGGGDSASLPSGSFSFDQTIENIFKLPRVYKPSGDFKITVSATLSGRKHSTFYVSDRELAKSLVKAAIDATTDKRIHEIWNQKPIE